MSVKYRFFIIFFFFIAVFSYSQSSSGRNIFISGTAVNNTQRNFFIDNFRMEGAALGYNIVDNINEALYSFRFNVTANTITYSDGSTAPASAEEGRYLIMVSLIRNSDNFEVVSFGFPFTELDEMYAYNQYLFFRAVINIPIDEPAAESRSVPGSVDDDSRLPDSWHNRRIYFRASLDYPIRLYILEHSDDLISGVGAYDGSFHNPSSISPLDNKFLALPGFTLGLELQLFNWLSIEPFFQVNLGDPFNVSFLEYSAGGLLKLQFKNLRDVVLSPYGIFNYSLNQSSVFSEFPPISAGGGIQIAVRGGGRGAFFFDIGYLIRLETVSMHNFLDPLFPNPPAFSYMQHTFRIAFGYKIGFFNRN